MREALERAEHQVASIALAAPDRFTLATAADSSAVAAAFGSIDSGFSVTAIGGGRYQMTLRPEAAAAIREDAVQQAERTITRRVNELGVSEPDISRHQGRDVIDVQLPGVADVARAKALLQATGLLEFSIVERGPADSAEALMRDGQPPPNLRVVSQPSRAGGGATAAYFLVRARATVTGADLRTARATLDQHQRPAVAFTFTPEGGRRFAALTGDNIGRPLAVLLDGRVAEIATIEARIQTDGQIAGGLTTLEAQNLAIVLRSGSLLAPFTYLSEQIVSATLGADAIRAGVLASIAALALVAAFMVWYYRLAGVNAVCAMAANLIILLGLLAGMNAVLTLPGIAGFVLTIGIGVDSNVLIFERIKEELNTGQTVRAAVDAGYQRVFMTLLDTHIAALISAALLFQFGTSAIRGFAATLAAGLAANLFTSTLVSKTLLDLVLRWKGRERLSI
jgi:preprotein translocase subunit SecD